MNHRESIKIEDEDVDGDSCDNANESKYISHQQGFVAGNNFTLGQQSPLQEHKQTLSNINAQLEDDSVELLNLDTFG